jgi:hypothetical protein
MSKKALLGLAILVWFPRTTVMAQFDNSDLRLHLRRVFGYQGGDRIQGTFSLEVSSELELVEVTYLIDGELFASTSEPPYRVSFSTSDYEHGKHSIRAYARDAVGERVESQIIVVHFITAEEGWQTAGRMAGWILGGTLALMLVGGLVTNRLSRGGGGFDLGDYGAAGGAVCGRCQLPFNRHVFSPNLLFGKLERCPHCGRIAIVPRASRLALDEAEERYMADKDQGQRTTGRHGAGDYQQMLDDSRYDL